MSNEPHDPEQDNTTSESQNKEGSLEELAGELLGVNLNSTSKSKSDVSLDDLDWGGIRIRTVRISRNRS